MFDDAPQVAVYWVRVDPFRFPAVKATSIWPLPEVTVPIVGAEGTSCAVTDPPTEPSKVPHVPVTEQNSSPTLLPRVGVVETLNSYVVPPVRLEMTVVVTP